MVWEDENKMSKDRHIVTMKFCVFCFHSVTSGSFV